MRKLKQKTERFFISLFCIYHFIIGIRHTILEYIAFFLLVRILYAVLLGCMSVAFSLSRFNFLFAKFEQCLGRKCKLAFFARQKKHSHLFRCCKSFTMNKYRARFWSRKKKVLLIVRCFSEFNPYCQRFNENSFRRLIFEAITGDQCKYLHWKEKESSTMSVKKFQFR